MKRLIIFALVLFLMIGILQGQTDKNLGGPDSGGYYWKDSDEIDGPDYSWVEISSLGTPLHLGDEESLQVPIGFDFDFYGTVFDSLYITSNGYISFTSDYVECDHQYPIPNPRDPSAYLAPFFTDLDPGTLGEIYYHYDSANGNFIIQFDNVPLYGESNGNTFQIILNSRNEVFFQYKSMNGTLDFCMVGIENPEETTGLQVAYNSPYLKNNLSLKFYRSSITYDGTISLSTASLSYGNITVGKTLTKSFTISNIHSSEILTGEIATMSGYEVSESSKQLDIYKYLDKNILPFEINPNSSITYDLVFAPSASTSYNGNIVISSSDTQDSIKYIAVSGTGVYPDISLSQTDTLFAKAYIGTTYSDSVTVYNSSLGILDFSSSINYSDTKLIEKGSGGPDNYNYYWKDSNEPDGPAYEWIEISTTGTALVMTDETVISGIQLGFNYNFYGNSFNTINIFANGYLSFTFPTSYYIHYSLPNISAPFNLLAAYWTDLNPALGGTVYYFADTVNKRFIVQYNNIRNFGTAYTNTFEIIIYETGEIVYQYKEINGPKNTCTVGIQNSDGSDGLTVSYNTNYIENGLALRFRFIPKWITVTPSDGSILAGSSDILNLEFNSSAIEEPGKFYADLQISSNDPDTPLVLLPLAFEVYTLATPANLTTSISGADLVLSWSSVPHATGYIVYSSSIPYGTYAIDNGGNLTGTTWRIPVVNSKKFYKVTATDE